MDATDVRTAPVVFPASIWMLPSDRMVIRRYKPVEYFSDTLQDGYRAKQAGRYDDIFEGRATARTRRAEEEQASDESVTLANGEEMDLAEGMRQWREANGYYYYPNCWRLGTDESETIWDEYADLEHGVAIETTVGKLKQHLAPSERISMGFIRYLDWLNEAARGNDAGWPFFFKTREYDEEQEFRALANRGGNALFRTDGLEFNEEHIPEDNPEVINIPANQDDLIERVILAPEATDEVRSQVESDLEDADLDVPVVPSRLNSSDRPSRGYVARLAGADNYGGREDYLEGLFHGFVEETDWDTWETVDVVQINRKGHLSPRDVFLELYRYEDHGPDREVYGHDHLQYEVRAHRYRNGEHETTYLNDHAEETREQLEDESTD
jgi:hypothetical protein